MPDLWGVEREDIEAAARKLMPYEDRLHMYLPHGFSYDLGTGLWVDVYYWVGGDKRSVRVTDVDASDAYGERMRRAAARLREERLQDQVREHPRRRTYELERRNNRWSVDEYKGRSCQRNVIGGLQSRVIAEVVAAEMRRVISNFAADNGMEDPIPFEE